LLSLVVLTLLIIFQDELNALNEDEVEEPVPQPIAEGPSVGPGDMGLSLVTMLEERLKMYQEAEGNAKAAGETSRARR
jgi:hypothetical protein